MKRIFAILILIPSLCTASIFNSFHYPSFHKMRFIGKCSWFGGLNDPDMGQQEGLAFYERNEARSTFMGIFNQNDLGNANTGVSHCLNTNFPYIALPVDASKSREEWRKTPFKVTNPATGQWEIAFLVDRGPASDTDRICDMSPGLMERLGLNTDQLVIVESLSPDNP